MNRFKLNMSQRSMLLNESAFPGEPINTIAIKMVFPQSSTKMVECAVNKVISSTDVFGYKLTKVNLGDLIFEEDNNRSFCSITNPVSREEAEIICGKREKEVFTGFPECRLYDALIIPVEECRDNKHSDYAILSFRFHHVLIDGYSMCMAAQKILDALETQINMESCISPENDCGTSGTVKVTTYSNCNTNINCDIQEANHTVENKSFWAEYFNGVQLENHIMSGKPAGYSRSCYTYELGRELTAEIDQFAEKYNITSASVFSGALSAYLSFACQSKDAVFMMPRLNRSTAEERSHFGCHTLVVPVRVTVDEDMTFSILCSQALKQAKEASKHKDYGIENIISDLKEEGITESSISEYTLNYYQPVLHSDIPYEISLSMDGAMHNHLTVNITRLMDNLCISYDSRDGIYTEEMTYFFHEAFIGIIRQGFDGNIKLKDMSFISEREKRILGDINGKKIDIDSKATIGSLFRNAVKKYGERPALYSCNDEMTFNELDRASNRVANALISRGVKGGQPVLYMLNRDIRLIPVMLGIVKSGAAFIPVDPNYPADRIEYIMSNSNAEFIISSANVNGSSAFNFLEADLLLGFDNDEEPCVYIPQEQLAYCIYTSGTTGRPKGVMLSHRGIVNITNPDNNPFNRDICRNARGIVAIGSVCFDISLFEMFVPLFNGMFIEFAPENALADPAKLAGLITAHGADILHCTPSRLTAYLHDISFSSALSNIKAVLAAGEVLPVSLIIELDKKYGIRIYNGYGPTETTIGATITEANDDKTIGRPIANLGLMILDDKGRILPYGATGEICVYGAGVGIGYYGLPEQTEARFVTRYGRRMYRTGDLGELTADGRIIYHGRNDNQVKLRGLRIELSEIENRINVFSGIDAANVLVRNLAGSQHLVAFYTVKEGKRVDVKKLKEALRSSLPVYMLPDVYKELAVMPQTPGGKTDLKALAQEPVEYVRVYRAPANETEAAICEAFGKILGIPEVGSSDSFFEIGGDSLHMAELISELEERLPGRKAAFEDIFHYPTPELLAGQMLEPAKRKEEPDILKELDYTGISELLSDDESGRILNENGYLGNVLLTGATGFLGIHILIELLNNPERWNRIWCVVRPTERLTASKRIRGSLFYYGENDYLDLWDERLFVIDGDITNVSGMEASCTEKIDTVINSAANVSHFAYDDKLEKVNTGAVKGLIDFCVRQSAAFVQISTVSVGGIYSSDNGELTFNEKNLYIGQEIKNKYILSKYMAEYELFKAAVNEGLKVRIMRVGNLQGRISDGEFQMNSRTNAFTRQISTYVKLGTIPESLYNGQVNFSPVDDVARIIVTLAGTGAKTAAYHVYPPCEVPFKRLFCALEKIGHTVNVVSDKDFAVLLEETAKTREGKVLTEGILLERPNMNYRDTMVTDSITTDILEKLKTEWKPITDEYLDKYFKALDDLQMFE